MKKQFLCFVVCQWSNCFSYEDVGLIEEQEPECLNKETENKHAIERHCEGLRWNVEVTSSWTTVEISQRVEKPSQLSQRETRRDSCITQWAFTLPAKENSRHLSYDRPTPRVQHRCSRRLRCEEWHWGKHLDRKSSRSSRKQSKKNTYGCFHDWIIDSPLRDRWTE